MAYTIKKHKAIYWDIPKNASTSLKEFFAKDLGFHRIGENQDYFSFAFVRHPFHRLYSLYKNFILKEPITNEHFTEGVENNALVRYGLFYAGMPFDEFAIKIISIPITDADPHFIPQWMQISGSNIYIAKMEDFGQEWKKISSVLKISKSPKVLNQSDSSDWREAYTEELKNLVGKHYELDFTFYGYKS